MKHYKNGHYWELSEHEFARSIQVRDVGGFFEKKLVIQPGFQAAIIDEGQFCANVPAGTYTLESFYSRLQFWRPKQCTVVLVRQEDHQIAYECGGVATQENLFTGVQANLTLQIMDVAFFLRNVMGSRDVFTFEELEATVKPSIGSAIAACIGGRSIVELSGPAAQHSVDKDIERSLRSRFEHFGLRFGLVESISISHARYDEHRQKLGEVWLLGQQAATERKINDLYSQSELESLRRGKSEASIRSLRAELETQQFSNDVEDAMRRLEIKRGLRDALASDRQADLRIDDDFKRFVHEQQLDELLRQQELDELRQSWLDAQNDESISRQQLLERQTIEHDKELERVLAVLRRDQQREDLQHQIELTRLTDADENRRTRERLERQLEEQERRYSEEERRFEFDLKRTVQQNEVKNRQAKEEIEIARFAESQKNKLQAEQNDVELDRIQKLRRSTIEDFIHLSEINNQQADQDQRRAIETKKVDAEIEAQREERSERSRRELVDLLKDADAEHLIAHVDAENAERLADLLKHRMSEHTKQQIAAGDSNAKSQAADEIRYLLERSIERERQNAEDRVRDLKEASQDQRQIMRDAISTVGQIGKSASQTRQSEDSVQSHRGKSDHAQSDTRIIICRNCRAENAPSHAHCYDCGTRL